MVVQYTQRFRKNLDIHLVDLDVTAVVLYLNFGHRFTLFLLYFDRFDAFLQNGSGKCKPNQNTR